MKFNFRLAVVEAANSTHLEPAQRQALHQANTRGDLAMWKRLESRITRRYEREKKVVLPQGFDWMSVLSWLVANIGTIIKLLLIIFAL